MSGAWLRKKGPPSLAGRPPPFDHVLGDARLRDLKPELAQFAVCESAQGPDADRHVKLLIQFAVERSLASAYSHDKCFLLRCAPNLTWPQRAHSVARNGLPVAVADACLLSGDERT